ncbi:hypothetical protein AHF37_05022 [Paragonimus kellicotti]|nr:hypothetical protein AHF37_05022 [Paragonimus kellicotti]
MPSSLSSMSSMLQLGRERRQRWRIRHQEFQTILRPLQTNSSSPGSATISPRYSDLKTCQHCHRSFNEVAYFKHVIRCETEHKLLQENVGTASESVEALERFRNRMKYKPTLRVGGHQAASSPRVSLRSSQSIASTLPSPTSSVSLTGLRSPVDPGLGTPTPQTLAEVGSPWQLARQRSNCNQLHIRDEGDTPCDSDVYPKEFVSATNVADSTTKTDYQRVSRLQPPLCNQLSPLLCSSPSTASSLSTVSLVEASTKEGENQIDLQKLEQSVQRTTPHCPWSPTISSFARHTVPVGEKHVFLFPNVLPNLNLSTNLSSLHLRLPNQPMDNKPSIDHTSVNHCEVTSLAVSEPSCIILSPASAGVANSTDTWLESEDELMSCAPHLDTRPAQKPSNTRYHHGKSHAHKRHCKHRCAPSDSRYRIQTQSTIRHCKCLEKNNHEQHSTTCLFQDPPSLSNQDNQQDVQRTTSHRSCTCFVEAKSQTRDKVSQAVGYVQSFRDNFTEPPCYTEEPVDSSRVEIGIGMSGDFPPTANQPDVQNQVYLVLSSSGKNSPAIKGTTSEISPPYQESRAETNPATLVPDCTTPNPVLQTYLPGIPTALVLTKAMLHRPTPITESELRQSPCLNESVPTLPDSDVDETAATQPNSQKSSKIFYCYECAVAPLVCL